MSASPEAVQILDLAADHIAAVGLAQGERWDSAQEAAGAPRRECRVCPLGAIATVAYGNPEAVVSDPFSPADEARYALARQLGVRAIPAWNDAPGRTATEAVQALRDTAARMRTAVAS